MQPLLAAFCIAALVVRPPLPRPPPLASSGRAPPVQLAAFSALTLERQSDILECLAAVDEGTLEDWVRGDRCALSVIAVSAAIESGPGEPDLIDEFEGAVQALVNSEGDDREEALARARLAIAVAKGPELLAVHATVIELWLGRGSIRGC